MWRLQRVVPPYLPQHVWDIVWSDRSNWQDLEMFQMLHTSIRHFSLIWIGSWPPASHVEPVWQLTICISIISPIPWFLPTAETQQPTDASWCPPGADTTQHTVFVLKHRQHHGHWRPHPEKSQELEIHGGNREQHSEQEGWIRDGSKLLQAWRYLYVRDETQSRHSQRRVHDYRIPRPAKEGQKQTWWRSSASDPGLLLNNRSEHAQQYSRYSFGPSIPQTPKKAVPRSILSFTKWGCCQTDGRTGNVTQES